MHVVRGKKIDVLFSASTIAMRNLELAKERAKAVRAALVAAGIAQDRINMKPPAEITGGGDNKEARRVEINAGA